MKSSFRCFLLISLFVAGCNGPFTGPTAAVAQHSSVSEQQERPSSQIDGWQRSPDQERPKALSRDRDVGSVPEWAESTLESPHESRTSSSNRSVSPNATTDAPEFPDEPQKVPLGPAGWLAVIGMGYGILQLRDSDQ